MPAEAKALLLPGNYLLRAKYYMTHYYNGLNVGTQQYFMNKVVAIKSADEVVKVKFDNW